MAAGTVTFLLIKLTEIIEKEEALLTGIKKEVQSINSQLSFMKDYLLKITDEDTQNSAGLQELAAQVRDVANDLEDALDDYKLRVARDHGQGYYVQFEKTFHFVKSSCARHSIAAKLRNCKSRVEHVSMAYGRHIIDRGLTPGHQLNTGGRRSGATVLSNARLVEEAELVGVDKRKKKVVDWLVDEDISQLRVISVVGMPGLGKTTVVKRAYEDPDVRELFVLRAWITLTQPFQKEDLLKDIIRQFYEVVRMPDISGMDNMDTERLRTVIRDFLKEKIFLIVLDDICHESDWLNFGPIFPNCYCGGRVLLTTRETNVAKTCSARCPENVYSLNPLSEEDSWTLFCNITFPNTSCPQHLFKVSNKILEKCEGLPLAIVTVGGALVKFDRSRKDEWEKFYSLGNVLAPGNRLTEVLLNSYNCLPHHLRSCFMYFSIFPEGDAIERMRLVRLWIAEGFVEGRDGLTLEDVATMYLKELVSRNLVQVVKATSDGQVKTCRVHRLLREIMILKAKKEGFFASVNENSSESEFPKKVRRLAIYNAKASLRQRRCPSQLRSVLMFWRPLDPLFVDDWHMFELSSGRLRLLKVLELRGAPLNTFPHGVVSLPSLKYLSLRNTNVRSIPRSIGKLKNLETLDLKHAPISELPHEISKLQKLRHLLVYHYGTNESGGQVQFKCGFKAPAQIGELLFLQKLCFLETDDEILSKLRNLRQLTRLGILKLRKRDGKSLCLLIEAQENLLALSVTSANDNELIDIDNLNPESCPKFLRRLYLTGRLEKLPNWISALDNLATVVLKGSRLADDPLLSLQDLPSLVHMELIQVYDGKVLTFQSRKFQKLKFLGLNKLDGLVSIDVKKEALPLLEELIVEHCHTLQEVPFGVEYMSELKSLKFFDMPLDFIRRLRHDGGDDYPKVKNVREVLGTYQINGAWEVYSKASFEGGGNTAGPSTSTTANMQDWKLL